MKTQTFGSYTYFVVKYYNIDDSFKTEMTVTRWSKAKYAFKDCKKHREEYGENNAFVFKAKQCIQVE